MVRVRCLFLDRFRLQILSECFASLNLIQKVSKKCATKLNFISYFELFINNG